MSGIEAFLTKGLRFATGLRGAIRDVPLVGRALGNIAIATGFPLGRAGGLARAGKVLAENPEDMVSELVRLLDDEEVRAWLYRWAHDPPRLGKAKKGSARPG